MKVLILAMHRQGRSPSQRFRFEQYLELLRQRGVECTLSPLLNEADDRVFYQRGHFFRKLFIIAKAAKRRATDALRCTQFDWIFIQREAFMTGTTFFERWMKKRGARLIFDFDDSIWLQNVSEANRFFAFAKNPGKTARLIANSEKVVAGNQYLADYARRFNSNVLIIPTTINTEAYVPSSAPDEPVVVGWSGSITTIVHFQYALPALRRLVKRYGNRVRIEVIGDGNFTMPELGIQGKPWRENTELADLSRFHIGIMPLPDDEWAKGKCGLKGLQYMALGIATIMSPVGVNTEIITHGVNGMLSTTDDEWFDALCQLIDNPELRQQLGRAGRQSVVDHYSVQANSALYLQLFDA